MQQILTVYVMQKFRVAWGDVFKLVENIRLMKKHHQVVVCPFNTEFLSIVTRAIYIIIQFVCGYLV